LAQEERRLMGGVGMPEHEGKADRQSGFAHAEIRAQLDRILASPEFHATDKMRDFLRFVVEEKLDGRSHRLKGYTIAVNVFGRGDDFDATNDPIVRIQAGRLRRALERYYLVGGVRDPIMIDIPKGRYIPRFTVRSAPQETEGAPFDRSAQPDADRARGPSLAVLPFENLTDDPEQLVLTVGLTEELVTELTRFQDISVIACRMAQQPPEFPTDPIELARKVGARFVLRGAVRRDAETVKVSAQLTDTAGGRQIWADASTHPLEASRLIATQEQIASDVVAAVASEFGIIARRLSAESRRKAPADLRTYEAMLRYYNHQIAPSSESAADCFTALRAASEREPKYGPVWSALATLHCQMYAFDAPGFDNSLETALAFARKGVFLEPGSQLGRLILAYASYLADDDDSFRAESETALALNPNSPYTVGAIGYMRVMRGELEHGLSMLDRAIAASPCHPSWFRAGEVIDLMLRGEYEQALAETRKHKPFRVFWDDAMTAALLGKLGRGDEAQPHMEAVRAQKSDLAARARELMRRSLKIDALIDDLVDGLRSAGMAIEAP
jgi:adenylate cyclase